MNDLISQYFELIRKDPDDAAPRLILADYFEEQGQLERATLIRLQVERAALPYWHAQAVRLELQERALLAQHDAQWRADLPSIKGLAWGAFERGFVRRLAVDDLSILTGTTLETCTQACPVYGLAIRWPRLKERPALEPIEGLREITITGTQMHADDVKWLAHSPLLSTIHTLNLVETQLDAPGLEALLASPHIAALQALRIPLHSFADDGIEHLVQSKLPALVDLDISVATEDELGSGGRYEETMGADSAMALRKWPVLGQLQRLDISGNQLGVDGLLAVLSSENLTGLKQLAVRGVSDWGDEGEKDDVLPAFQNLAPGMLLDELDIGENDLNLNAAEHIVSSPALQDLKVLRCDYTQQGPGLDALLAAPWLDSLRVLSMGDSMSTALDVVLKRCPKELHTLLVPSHYAWSQAENLVEVLQKATPNPNLLQLDLGDLSLEDEQLLGLNEVSCLPNLLSLRLADVYEEADPEVAKQFADSPFAKNLISLTMDIKGVDRLPLQGQIAMGHGSYRGNLREL